MRVKYRFFKSDFESWDSLFDAAAAFASKISPECLIGISHSHGGTDYAGTGVITVWYWEDQPSAQD